MMPTLPPLLRMTSFYRFNVFKAASYLWRTRNAPVASIPKENVLPLYQGTPGFMAKWALVFLSMDIMYMTSMVYECWDGGQLYHNPFQNIKTRKPSSENPLEPPLVSDKPIKSIWTRVAFGAFHCGLGGLVAAFLLSQRASWVRSMTIVRPLSKTPQLYIEVAGHPNGYGHPFLLKDCRLSPTHLNKNIMMVTVKDEGKFPFYPHGATIAGKPMPATGDVAKINMLKIWKNSGGKIDNQTQS